MKDTSGAYRSQTRQKRIRAVAEMITSNGATYREVMTAFRVSEVTARQYCKAAMASIPTAQRPNALRSLPAVPGTRYRREDYEDSLSHTDGYAAGFEAGKKAAHAASTAPSDVVDEVQSWLSVHSKQVIAALEDLRVTLLGERASSTGNQSDTPRDVQRYLVDHVLRATDLHGFAALCPSVSVAALKRYAQRGAMIPVVDLAELEHAYVLVRFRELELDDEDLEQIDQVLRKSRRARLDAAAEGQRQ